MPYNYKKCKPMRNSLILIILSILVGACGSVPVPRKGMVAAPQSTGTGAEAASASVLSDTPTRPTPPIVPIVSEEPRKSLPTAKANWQEAIQYLQMGDEQSARYYLAEALRIDPDNVIAKNLAHQIQADPLQELGTVSFDYQIQNGDSLSRVAKNFLNDPLKFHILAKYNGITNPSTIQVGQAIKVPGTQPVTPVSVVSAPESVSKQPDPVYTKAKKLYDEAKYQAAIALLEEEAGDLDSQFKSPQTQQLLVNAYSKLADSFRKGNQLNDAQKMLQKAVILQPTNATLTKGLKEVANEVEAERYYQSGVKSLDSGAPDKAQEAFVETLKRNPRHALAKQKLEAMKVDVVETYYKNAMAAYRRQELATAIAGFDRVIELDPNHENAKLYRARSIELKLKLEKFADK